MSRAGRKIDVSTSPGARSRFVAWLAVAFATAGAPACMTTGEGEKMQAEIADLRARLDEIDRRDKEYKEQVVRLKKVLDEATSLLTRNSADVGAKAQKAEQDIAALQGRIEEMTHAQEVQARQAADEHNRFETRLGTLEQTASKIVDKVAPTMPDDKDQLWTQAGQRLASGSATTAAASTASSSSAFRRTRAPRRPISRSGCRSCRRASTRTRRPSSRRCSTPSRSRPRSPRPCGSSPAHSPSSSSAPTRSRSSATS
jgi:TolA-binding protein